MLLPGCRFNRGENLPADAQFGKSTEGEHAVVAEITDRFEQTDHPFLHDIFMVGADQEIRAGFPFDDTPIFT